MKKQSFHLFFSLLFALAAALPAAGQEKRESVSVVLPENPTRQQVVEAAVKVRPSYRQLDYQQREMLGFIHIGMNTFTGAEWGTGKENISLFNPEKLNAEKWVKTFKDAGITGVILVTKHHDGFCVWPSKHTAHTVANTPWRGGKGDLVREVADACRKHGMKLCLYLSPWDMHEKTYGTAAYNDFYKKQLKELLTNYGDVYLLWFDGAGTTKDVSGKEMPFDWEGIFSYARELQPDVLLSGTAPDIRWVGNEVGKGRETEWSVQGINNMEKLFGTLKGYSARVPNLGTIDELMKGKRKLVWYPSRGGLPLRKGWFYNAEDDKRVKSLEYLVNSYFSTVGQNSNLLPNLSPDKSGQIPEFDARRLIDFGNVIKRMKSVDYAAGAKAVPVSGWAKKLSKNAITDADPFTGWHTPDGTTQAVCEIGLPKKQTFNVIKLQENIRDFGQRVEKFAVDAYLGGEWKEVAASTTIGFRKMLRLKSPIETDKLRIRFLDARVSISFSNISLYFLEPIGKETANVVANNEIKKSAYKTIYNGLKTQKLPNNAIAAQIIKLPAEIVFEFKKSQMQKISGIAYLPLENGGYIENYRIQAKNKNGKWETIAEGRFGNIINNPVEQVVRFEPVSTQSLRLIIVKTAQNVKTITIKDIKPIR